ncbi:PiggyBac transposable element-derived protein 3 [Pseudolycoriella hygida]|uniref:PiggyBac transposable element-derived protein 3 n=1 Tax=Pseudolycoriella hygida TaxID=35572 RepID=A0A9Q0N610_9DIPT|nr:PiggyBac transposable element-derived protein 3 [Pseudolycoriella hygida]
MVKAKKTLVVLTQRTKRNDYAKRIKSNFNDNKVAKKLLGNGRSNSNTRVLNKSKKNVGKENVQIGNKKSKRCENQIKWSVGGESVGPPAFNFPNKPNYSENMRAEDFFELFFDDALVEMIIHTSTEYSLSKNLPDISLSKVELRAFFGILILSGYNRLPGKPMYWNSDKDMRNEAVAETMRRDRFDKIMQALHFTSNTNLDQSDKFAKLRPVIYHLQKQFMRNFMPTDEAISHDEAMVEYFGNHGCKQAIREKPIRFGYKIFCQNTTSGYLIAFNPYQGRTFDVDEEMEEKFGKSSSSLLHLLDSNPLSKSECPYHFYCDNYFSSIPLLSELKDRGYNCTGTIKANRVGKDCPLMDMKRFKKQYRGYAEVVTAHHKKNKIFLNRWKDNSAVTVASACYAVNPTASVKRWCKNERKHIEVSIPDAINKYNKNMGGTDRTNQNINNYRISIRGKKWWWSLFTWMLDASVQNAWCLARQENPKLTQLRFRRNLVKAYFAAYKNLPKSVGRKPSVSQVGRLDGTGHFPRRTSNNKQRRCAGSNCKSAIRQEYSKCNIYAMNRVKRWLLLLAAVVIVLPNVQALKATALIFGRTPSTSSTTSTSTTEAPVSDENEEAPSADQTEEEEATKPPLTGIPQIDYIWDPNLPRELNGFNLSTYPFLSGVPDAEDIDFKCDGLHDGFYASIKFGCQLYHHCIYGIRHDFLCANFTAFDQKTFICHFVSEVNCKNSPKYWFRNDALYRATTTTTTTTTTIAPPPTTERRRRKPLRQRRPQNDYYYDDEEYEDEYVVQRPNRRRKPIRNRYRPIYDDEYPENDRGYDEEEEPLEDDYDYEQRMRNRNRPGNNRRYRNRERNNRRNLNDQRSTSRSKDDEPRSLADTRQPEPTRRYNRDRRPVQDERERVRERDRNRYVTNNNKRPLKIEEEEDLDIEYERPRSTYDDTEEELPKRNNFRNNQPEKRVKSRPTPAKSRDDFDDAPPPPRRKNVREEPREEELPKVRPSSNGASVFNRPRVAPRISRPVPLNEKQKYDYKKSEAPPAPPSAANGKDDYYDEYEDELPPQKTATKPEVRPQAQHQSKTIVAPPDRNPRPHVKEDILKDDQVEYEDVDEKSYKSQPISKTETQQVKNVGTRNTNENTDRSSVPTGPSIFQGEQQQTLRDKYRNNLRSQSRHSTEETEREVEIPLDERKQTSEQQNARNKYRNSYRPSAKEVRPSLIQTPTSADEDFEDAPKEKPSVYLSYKAVSSRLPPTAREVIPQINEEPPFVDEPPRREQNKKNQPPPPSGTDSLNEDVEVRPAVRVVKRPFLPSRGGSPYLPRGLRPVGSSDEESYTSTSIKEQHQPEEIVPQQPNRNSNYDQRQHFPGPLTTQPPQSDPPKDPLEHIYSEYDVTLNDALNPTLKPLITSRGSPIGFSLNNKYDQQQYSYVPLNAATAQSRSSIVQVPYADKKFKTYVDEYEY